MTVFMRLSKISPKLFIENRRRLAELLAPNALAVVNANDTAETNADGTQKTIVNSDLFYLTGIEQEQSILLLYPNADNEKRREVLFLREGTAQNELWEGHKLTKEEAREISGIENIHWLPEFRGIFHQAMCESEAVYLNSNEHGRADSVVESRDARFAAGAIKKYPLHQYHRLARLMHRLRAVKSRAEIELIAKACAITDGGFRRVLRFVRPGVTEYEVEAEFTHEFIRNRARFAYAPIIASGMNACCLHYIANQDVCKSGDLLLLDVGANYGNYSSDMTRTIPVNGRFTRRQRRVYDAVLRVMRQCAAGLTPGKKPKEWQKEAEQSMERELVELGLLTTREIKRQKKDAPALKQYFMHGVGHSMGLDVHDVTVTGEPMQAGWVMTVEPGIYLPKEGFAVRLENDVLVTEKGPVDLMAHIPVEADEIEAIMAQKNPARKKRP